jgi:hypothetical protein
MNQDITVSIEGREFHVELLYGRPWYVSVRVSTGVLRVIWHKDGGRPYGPLTARAVSAALDQIAQKREDV